MAIIKTKGINNIKRIHCALTTATRTVNPNLWLTVHEKKYHFKLVLMQKKNVHK